MSAASLPQITLLLRSRRLFSSLNPRSLKPKLLTQQTLNFLPPQLTGPERLLPTCTLTLIPAPTDLNPNPNPQLLPPRYDLLMWNSDSLDYHPLQIPPVGVGFGVLDFGFSEFYPTVQVGWHAIPTANQQIRSPPKTALSLCTW